MEKDVHLGVALRNNQEGRRQSGASLKVEGTRHVGLDPALWLIVPGHHSRWNWTQAHCIEDSPFEDGRRTNFAERRRQLGTQAGLGWARPHRLDPIAVTFRRPTRYRMHVRLAGE
jgi:hypothetical protein